MKALQSGRPCAWLCWLLATQVQVVQQNMILDINKKKYMYTYIKAERHNFINTYCTAGQVTGKQVDLDDLPILLYLAINKNWDKFTTVEAAAAAGAQPPPPKTTTTLIIEYVSSFIDTKLIKNFYINYIKLSSSTCFERHPLIFRRSMMLTVHVCSLWYSHSLQVAVLCTC